MSWQDYFPKIIVPNLAERKDRFTRMKQMLFDYGIEAVISEATRHEDGRLGLIITMKEIFKWCLEQNFKRVIIFEDDCDIIVNVDEFHSVMDNCCEDLKNMNWDLFYMGVQHPASFFKWATPNLLRVSMGFSTHAVGYSRRAMEFVLQSHIDEPFDNFLVREFQKYNTSYCSYPILCSQIAGHSDICKDWIDWSQFIKPTFDKNVKDILHARFKTEL